MTAVAAPPLAVDGGERSVPRSKRIAAWPQVVDDDRTAVLDALDSGRFTTAASGEQHIGALEREWADAVGVGYCVATDNGTSALMLALAAAGVEPGDDVLVPSLSFIASALAPVHLGANPVFVDVDPLTYNVTPEGLAAAVTPRTTAIVVVHLHGLPVDLDRISAFATSRGIALVEDAAQAHGATFAGAPVGGWGTIGSFSLNVSKNLATCGEGGLVTTADPAVHQRALMMRQFGEIIPRRGHRSYVAHMRGWNLKPGALNCAFTRSQLRRFADVDAVRRANVERFLGLLDPLPGLRPPSCPADRTHAWHILRFGLDPAELDLDPGLAGPLRATLMRLLRAEGVPASTYQALPLPAQPPLRDHVAAGQEFPGAYGVIDSTFTIQKAHLHPDAMPLLEAYATAFRKVWGNLPRVRELAVESADAYETPWAEAERIAAAEYHAGEHRAGDRTSVGDPA